MMKTDEVVEELRKLIPMSNPKNQKELENPNYALYALAPFWLPHQAICLLAQLKTMDEQTFRTCLNLKKLQISINFAFYGKDEWAEEINKKTEPSGKTGFGDFIMHHFPVPHSKITFLINLHEKLSEAIKNGNLSSKSEFQNKSQKTLLSPSDVILWAQKEKIIIPSELLIRLSFRDQINMLYLPKTFKDEINVYDKWNALCTEHKLSNPFSPLFKKPAHADELFPEEKAENQQENPKLSLESSTSLGLTDRAQEIYDTTLRFRKLAIESYLKNQFDRGAIDYSNLIDKLGAVEKEEFKIYNKAGPWPKMTEHCCRAIASIMRHFNKKILIRDLEQDSYMIEHGKKSRKISSSTFRKWMHAEGIHDRQTLRKNCNK
jgi:hypothetical protein